LQAERGGGFIVGRSPGEGSAGPATAAGLTTGSLAASRLAACGPRSQPLQQLGLVEVLPGRDVEPALNQARVKVAAVDGDRAEAVARPALPAQTDLGATVGTGHFDAVVRKPRIEIAARREFTSDRRLARLIAAVIPQVARVRS
ncbi:MAG: hypothetical protein ACK56I_36065, partial [bacterium]